MPQLSVQRDYLQEILGIDTDDAFVDSTLEDQLINLAYRKTAYLHNWPQLLRRTGIVIVADLDRYTLPTDLRKIEFVFQQGNLLKETPFDFVEFEKDSYSIGLDESDIILKNVPGTKSTDFTTSNNESAATSVVVELDTVTDLSKGDKVHIDDVSGTATSDEFAIVESIDTTNKTATITLAQAHNSSSIIRKTDDILYMGYQRTIVDLSADTDTPDTPTELDLPMLHYAAYLFLRLSEETKGLAESNLQIWKDEVEAVWLSFSKNSTGPTNQFYI